MYQDYKFGFIDKQGKIVIPCQYTNAGDFHGGLAVINQDYKYGFIDKREK